MQTWCLMQLLCSFVTPVMTVGHMVSFTVVTPGSAWSCALGSFVFGQQWSSGAVVMSWLVAFTELSGGAPRWGHGRLHIKVRACLEIKQRFGNVRSVYLLLRRTRSPEPSEFCIYSFFPRICLFNLWNLFAGIAALYDFYCKTSKKCLQM